MQPNKKALYVMMENPMGLGNNSLALDMQISDGMLVFADTNRGHMFSGHLVDEWADGFSFEVFQQEGAGINGLWVFREVTLEDFKQSISKTVGNGQAIAEQFRSTEDLWEWYRENFAF